MRILLVEDEVSLADALVYLLKKDGYQVDVSYDGSEGEDLALSGIYDGIVLDRMLPGREGLDILRTIRDTQLATPVMFLTARDSVHDRVDGLDAGADDYLIKPFSNQEFLARVRALTRRSKNMIENEELHLADTVLNIRRSLYTIGDSVVELTRTEAKLLELLIRNVDQVLEKEQILERIWGFNNEIDIANVDLYIYYLRKKIHFQDAGIELQTVRGVGYSLVQRGNRS